MGRVGLLLGTIGFCLGVLLAWFPQGHPINYPFAIPITIGGCMQILAQYNGYKAIREFQSIKQQLEASTGSKSLSLSERNKLEDAKTAALRRHVGNMISLFIMACGIPAIIRLCGDGQQVLLLIMAIGGMNYYANRYMTHYFHSTS